MYNGYRTETYTQLKFYQTIIHIENLNHSTTHIKS